LLQEALDALELVGVEATSQGAEPLQLRTPATAVREQALQPSSLLPEKLAQGRIGGGLARTRLRHREQILDQTQPLLCALGLGVLEGPGALPTRAEAPARALHEGSLPGFGFTLARKQADPLQPVALPGEGAHGVPDETGAPRRSGIRRQGPLELSGARRHVLHGGQHVLTDPERIAKIVGAIAASAQWREALEQRAVGAR